MSNNFSALKPFSDAYCNTIIPAKKVNTITYNYIELVKTFKPLRFMITLTFSYNMNILDFSSTVLAGFIVVSCCNHVGAL